MRCQCCAAWLTSTDGSCGYCGTVDRRYARGLTTTEIKTIRLPRPLPTSVPGPGKKVSR